MSIEKESASIGDFWSRVALRSNIVAIVGATYQIHEHRTSSHNQQISDNKSVHLIDHYLSKGKIPDNDTGDKIFAVSSLVYVCPDIENAIAIDRIKAHESSTEISLKDIEVMGAIPMAMLLVDLDCPVNEDNLRKITSVLADNYKCVDWSIFETDNSYHLVFDKFVQPEDLPKCYGELIHAFGSLESGYRKDYFEQIANDLITCNNNPEIVRTIFDKLTTEIAHYDEPENMGVKFIVDLRWIARNLVELLKFLETKSSGFAYLRIIGKTPDSQPPKLRVISRIHRMVNGQVISTSSDD